MNEENLFTKRGEELAAVLSRVLSIAIGGRVPPFVLITSLIGPDEEPRGAIISNTNENAAQMIMEAAAAIQGASDEAKVQGH